MLPKKRNKRAILTIYKQIPVLHILPGFLLGEFLGYYAALFNPNLLFISLLPFLRFKLQGLIISLGAIFSYIGFYSGEIPNLDSSRSYLVKSVDTARYYKPGEVTFNLKLLGLIEDEEVIPLGVQKIQCTAALLPWKNVSKLNPGESLVVRAKFNRIKPSVNPLTYSSVLYRKGHSYYL